MIQKIKTFEETQAYFMILFKDASITIDRAGNVIFKDHAGYVIMYYDRYQEENTLYIDYNKIWYTLSEHILFDDIRDYIRKILIKHFNWKVGLIYYSGSLNYENGYL